MKTGIIMKRLIYGRFISILIIAAFFFSAFSVTVQAAETEGNVKEVQAQGEITSDVNVRKGPGTDYDKIGTVREGDIVAITGESHDGWYRIEYDGGTGFIYGQYVSVLSGEPETSAPEETPGEDTEGNEPAAEEEDESASRFPSGLFKLIAVVVIIAVIIVMIFLTIRSLRQNEEEEDGYGEEEDEYEDEYEDEDGDEYEDEDEDDGEEYDSDNEDDEDREDGADRADRQNPSALKPEQTVIIREEDYQLHIDPKYFEDEPIAQPDYVTGYLKKKQEEAEAEAESKEEHSGELQKAMDKLQELQEEIEKLKKKQ